MEPTPLSGLSLIGDQIGNPNPADTFQAVSRITEGLYRVTFSGSAANSRLEISGMSASAMYPTYVCYV